jgi:hypothetical protein
VSTDLRAELLKVRKDYGALADQNVVDAARPPDHPLHSRFEWDDAICGEAYRREQARALIRSVRLTYKEADDLSPARSVRAFHAMPSKDGYAYDPVEEIADDPFRRQLLLNSAEREWKALLRRYEELEGFLTMVRRDVGDGEAKAA